MLANTRKKVASVPAPSSTSAGSTFDHLGSLASILGLVVSLYALRQTCQPMRNQ